MQRALILFLIVIGLILLGCSDDETSTGPHASSYTIDSGWQVSPVLSYDSQYVYFLVINSPVVGDSNSAIYRSRVGTHGRPTLVLRSKDLSWVSQSTEGAFLVYNYSFYNRIHWLHTGVDSLLAISQPYSIMCVTDSLIVATAPANQIYAQNLFTGDGWPISGDAYNPSTAGFDKVMYPSFNRIVMIQVSTMDTLLLDTVPPGFWPSSIRLLRDSTILLHSGEYLIKCDRDFAAPDTLAEVRLTGSGSLGSAAVVTCELPDGTILYSQGITSYDYRLWAIPPDGSEPYPWIK